MNQPLDDRELEHALGEAMRGRPAPRPVPGLAERAMARAASMHEAPAPAARWLRARRWVQWANAAAAVALVAWVLFAMAGPSGDQSIWNTSVSSESSQMEGSSSAQVIGMEDAALAGGVALAVIAIGWALANSLTGRPSSAGAASALMG